MTLNIRSTVFAAAVMLSGCASNGPPVEYLMETPAIYHGAALDPFSHLDQASQTTTVSVFYATNRKPDRSNAGDHLPYGNGMADDISLGEASVKFGDDSFSWEGLYTASISADREIDVPLTLSDSRKYASLEIGSPIPGEQQLTPGQRQWVAAINAQLAAARDPELMVYVHGTKVDFLNSVAMTAEIDHFAGRDFVGIAFAWPSHQNILYYLGRADVRRALKSSDALQNLLEFLAAHTTAKRINLLAYSAGGRVTSTALFKLRNAHADLDAAALRRRLRIGDVVFAAADVPVEKFLERLPAITDIGQEVSVMVSDHDPALAAAERFMGHGARAGTEAAVEEEETLVKSLGITNFHVVDVSLGQQNRGFDIIGHHYWYRHPWASSDILLLMRTDLPPPRRGLKPAGYDGVFFLPDEYPEEARNAARREIGASWALIEPTRCDDDALTGKDSCE
ncbi:alpha/beta hydrolase [Gammaproteobacteria bacterium]|jgi:esterase/lipase superfamily enzyme|nr:alpha/beta hydrolase [Gammaproteobacteria bacterium]